MNSSRSPIIHSAERAAYERIRSFVVGQVAKAGDSPMRLDSYRTLAKRFGVTQTTVMKALKDLIADGYLSIKPGVGAFTNPVRLRCSEKVRLIGSFAGDGKNVLFGRNYWQYMPAFIDRIMKTSSSYQIQHCFIGEAKPSVKEILAMGLDGVIWSAPSREACGILGRLREEKRLPVLSLSVKTPGASSVYYGGEMYLKAARKMFAEGRRRLLFLLPPANVSPEVDAKTRAGIERLYAQEGLPFDKDFIREDSIKGVPDLEELLRRLKPEGIVFGWGVLRHWKTIKATLDIENACRLCADDASVFDDMGYRGWTFKFDIESEAEAAAKDFAKQFENPDGTETLDREFSMTIEERGDER